MIIDTPHTHTHARAGHLKYSSLLDYETCRVRDTTARGPPNRAPKTIKFDTHHGGVWSRSEIDPDGRGARAPPANPERGQISPVTKNDRATCQSLWLLAGECDFSPELIQLVPEKVSSLTSP